MRVPAPEDYKPEWKRRSLSLLPIIPDGFNFIFKPEPSKAKHLREVGQLLKQHPDAEVVISTDAGPEGELIGGRILDYHRWRGRTSRFWTNGVDVVNLRKALAALQPGSARRKLLEATQARSDSDWLLGLNLSRGVKATMVLPDSDVIIAVGRVMTPTLGLVVNRDILIRDFKPRDYFEIVAAVATEQGGHQLSLRHSSTDEEKRLWERSAADELAVAVQGKGGTLQVEQKIVKKAPPSPLSLNDLQKIANRKHGWTAKETLQIAQTLYQDYKVLTYPRSDCNYYAEESWPEVPQILSLLQAPGILPNMPAPGWEPLKRRTVWDTSKGSDHFAIAPTTVAPPWDTMTPPEKACYRLVAQHYVACLLPDQEVSQTKITMVVEEIPFTASGNVPLVQGWRAMFDAPGGAAQAGARSAANKAPEVQLPPVQDGMQATIQSVNVETKQTRPPAFYTEGTLLADMEDVAKYVSDAKLRRTLNADKIAGTDIARQRGIGTVATRGDTIAKLIKYGYIQAHKGETRISATNLGHSLIGFMRKRLPQYVDPGLTAYWELLGEDILAGKLTRTEFIGEVARSCTEAIENLRAVASPEALAEGQAVADGTRCPKSGEPVMNMGKYWTFPGYPQSPCWKKVSERAMSVEDYVAIFNAHPEPGPCLEGFINSTTQEPFSRHIRYAPTPESQQHFKFVRPDLGDSFNLAEIPHVRAPHVFCRRQMSIEDYQNVLRAGKEGYRFEKFISSKGSEFSAALVYDAAANPPRFRFDFADDQPAPAKSRSERPRQPAASSRARPSSGGRRSR